MYLNINDIRNIRKNDKNRRKIAGRKTLRISRRFFNVKIVSYTPYSGLRLTLS